jgi:hypothetical protein
MKKLFPLVLAVSALVFSNFGAAQEKQRIPCPNPTHVSLTAPLPVAATPYVPDFPTGPCSAGFEPNFGGTKFDRCFRHTFRWKAETKRCQNIKGRLTIKYKALQSGVGPANDTVAIFSNGAVVSGTSLPLYSGSVTIGQTGTKTILLTAAMLTNNRVSFLLQDDTSVISAKLDVVVCCRK